MRSRRNPRPGGPFATPPPRPPPPGTHKREPGWCPVSTPSHVAFKSPRGLIARCFDARVIRKGFLRRATAAGLARTILRTVVLQRAASPRYGHPLDIRAGWACSGAPFRLERGFESEEVETPRRSIFARCCRFLFPSSSSFFIFKGWMDDSGGVIFFGWDSLVYLDAFAIMQLTKFSLLFLFKRDIIE